MTEPADMILPLLREMRSEIGSLRREGDERQRILIDRLDRLEQQQKNFSHALTADTLMSRLLTGEFEERIEGLERRVNELEKSK